MPSPSSPDSSPPQLTPQKAVEQQAEEDRFQEVKLLLVNLFDREQATIKAIMSCLYEVGAVNFINGKIKLQPLRSLVKPVARISKPIFIFMGYRWFQKKCPPLISNWLRRKVQFPAKVRPKPPLPQTAPTVSSEYVVGYQIEIQRLRSRLRLTTGALIGISATLVIILVRVNPKPVEQFWQSTVINKTTLYQSLTQEKQSEP